MNAGLDGLGAYLSDVVSRRTCLAGVFEEQGDAGVVKQDHAIRRASGRVTRTACGFQLRSNVRLKPGTQVPGSIDCKTLVAERRQE